MSYMMINLAQVSPPRQQVRIDGIQEDYPSSWAGGMLSEFGKSVPNQGLVELGGVRCSVWRCYRKSMASPQGQCTVGKLWETEPHACLCLPHTLHRWITGKGNTDIFNFQPSLVKGKQVFRSDVITAVWSHWQWSLLPGEAGANLGLRLELGPRSIGELIKAPGAGPAPYSYRLPVSHLVPAAAKVVIHLIEL